MRDRLRPMRCRSSCRSARKNDFVGIIDLIEKCAYIYKDDLGKEIEERDIPDEYEEQAEELRAELIEKVAELDEDLTMKYLEGEEITVGELKAALRKGVCNVQIFPVLCGSSYRNKGVQLLLDAVIDYLPSPLDVAGHPGHRCRTARKTTRKSSDDEPFAALAFKIMTDPYVGKLTFFRVYSGILNSGSYVLNSTKGKRERIGRILQMHANHREEITEVYAGDIAAAVGLKDTTTGDTLCDEKHPVILESMNFPDPVIDIAIEPKSKADQDKMGDGAGEAGRRRPDVPCLYRTRKPAKRSSPAWANLHLEIIVDRLLREFKVEANVGKPQVAYRETFRKPAEVEGKFIRQSGGRGQYGHVWIEFEPLEPGAGFVVREQDRRRRRAEGIRPGRAGRYRGSDAERRSGRLSACRHQGNARRRILPRRRLQSKWRSRSPDPWRSKAAKDMCNPVCSNRS